MVPYRTQLNDLVRIHGEIFLDGYIVTPDEIQGSLHALDCCKKSGMPCTPPDDADEDGQGRVGRTTEGISPGAKNRVRVLRAGCVHPRSKTWKGKMGAAALLPLAEHPDIDTPSAPNELATPTPSTAETSMLEAATAGAVLALLPLLESLATHKPDLFNTLTDWIQREAQDLVEISSTTPSSAIDSVFDVAENGPEPSFQLPPVFSTSSDPANDPFASFTSPASDPPTNGSRPTTPGAQGLEFGLCPDLGLHPSTFSSLPSSSASNGCTWSEDQGHRRSLPSPAFDSWWK